MARLALVLTTLALALALAAATDARRGPPLDLDVREPDWDKVESTIVCIPEPIANGGLDAAAAFLLGQGPAVRYRFSVSWGTAGTGKDARGCAAVTTVGSTEGAGRPAQVAVARTLGKVPAGGDGIRIRFGDCPVAPAASGCLGSRPYVFRIRNAGASAAACTALTGGRSPLATFVDHGGGRWRVLKSRGRFAHIAARDLVPALVDRVCRRSTPRAQRLGRELRIASPPQRSFQLATAMTYVHGGSTSNVCVFVWTRPGQPPLRGSVTLTGPGVEQTKAFTTRGGEAKTRIVFTVTERARYVASVTLAGNTAQAAASLGLAPTTSGEYSCLP